MQLGRMGYVLMMAAWVVGTSDMRAQGRPGAPEKLIIDTDLGDDIDDAFALMLALRSPELQVLGITTAFGDTELRARSADRLLAETGHGDVPVAVGVRTEGKTPFTQARYAARWPDVKRHKAAVEFALDHIRKSPGEITLVAIGLVNVGAMIDKDAATFRKLKRVVVMGGSVDRGYGDLDYGPVHGPEAEWNIANDPASAQKLLEVGVPVFFLPLDSTQLKLDEVKRALLFRQGNAYTDALALLYFQWGMETPTLYDPMTIAWVLKPSLCPMTRIRLRVDEKGFTRRESGAPNAQVCLQSSSEDFFRFYLPRLLSPEAGLR
jgi:purine nucleosidase